MDTEPVDPAVQAFEALRTEIAVLSAEITLALAEQRAIAAKPVPDYDLTLGRIAKQLAELTTRVAAVEGKPALAFTAQSFGTELGSIMRQEAGLARITLYQAMEAARGAGPTSCGRWQSTGFCPARLGGGGWPAVPRSALCLA